MRITLINPKSNALGLNLGLAYIAANLKKHGHEVLGLDLNNRPIKSSIEDYAKKRILEFKPNLIGVSLLSFGYQSGMNLINDIRRYYWCPIVVGGPDAFIEQENYFRDNINIDFVMVGEAEETMVELTEALNNGVTTGDFSKVGSLIYKDPKTGEIHKNEKRSVLQDLDVLPFLDYDCFEVEDLTVYPIVTSRGCIYNCSFCAMPLITGRTIRTRSISEVIKEIKLAKEKYPSLKEIQLLDDCFSANSKRVIEFCKVYKEAGINLSWVVAPGFRADGINEEVLLALKDAGMRPLIKLGVESYVPHVFELVEKGEAFEDINNAVKLCKKHGFKTQGFFIIGLPEDTKEGVLYTRKIAQEVGFDSIGFQMLMPFPRTRVYDWVQKHGTILVDHKRQSSSIHPGFTTPKFTAKEKLDLCRKFDIWQAREGTPYPFDGTKGNFYNTMLILYLITRYDLKYMLKHLKRLIPRFLATLKKGRAEEFVGIKFKEK